MKLDKELLQEILSKTRDLPSLEEVISFEEFTDKQLAAYHMSLLIDSSFIKGEYQTSNGNSPEFVYASSTMLTLDGHALLESLNDKSNWTGLRDKVLSGLGASLGFGSNLITIIAGISG